MNGHDLDNYFEEQGPGAVVTVEEVREFEVLMAAKEVSGSLTTPTSLVVWLHMQLTASAASQDVGTC